MSVRMKDIAHTLGISQTTVSHVLRGRDGEFRIGAETARRVRDAVERFGYRPSVLARNLKHHRAYALALAVGGRGARARAWLGPLGAALMAGYVFQTFTKSGWLALAAEALAMGALLAWSRRRHGRGADLLASLSPASRAPLLTAAALVLVLVNVSPSGLRIGPFAAAAHLAQTWRDSGIGRPAQPVASLSDDERANSIRSRRAI